MTQPSIAPARPSVGYLLSLGAGCVGLALGAVASAAIDELKHGADPAAALGGVGTSATFVMFVLLFSMRLIFWPRSSGIVRGITRAVLGVALCASLLLAVLSVGLLATGGGHGAAGFLPVWFTVAACLCQVGSVAWLIRYRGV